MSSTEGSPTKICWNRRSRAGSFSIRSRYSSSVVAPIIRSSPRASIGLSMLPASIAESPPAPVPTTVCSSSMKVMTWPSASLISWSTALSRSSNSPRYFAPATIAARSSDSTLRPLSESGTSPSTTRWASPSTTAVLPTPGSPMSTGLFLVRRDSTWIDAADLGVAADHRVEMPLLGLGGEVDGVLLQRLVGRLRVLAGDPLRPAHAGEGSAQRLRAGADPGEHRLDRALDRRGRDQQVLGGGEVVLHLCRDVLGGGEDLQRRAGVRRRSDRRSGGRRQLGQLGLHARHDIARLHPGGLEERPGDPVRLGQQRRQQVHGLDLRVSARVGRLDGRVDRLLAAGRELRCIHLGRYRPLPRPLPDPTPR